jgi:hypothetical protein
MSSEFMRRLEAKPETPENHNDAVIWTLVKGPRRMRAVARTIDAFDALELRYDINDRPLARH